MRKILMAGLLVLGACGQQSGGEAETDTGDVEAANAASTGITPGEADIKKASELVPANAELAAKYDRSCRACHSTPDAAAPLTGHKAAWDARFEEKDEDALLESTKAGLNAMPPMGLCNDCSDEELKALTAFMAGRGS